MALMPNAHAVDMSDTTEKVIGNFGSNTKYGKYIEITKNTYDDYNGRRMFTHDCGSNIKIIGVTGYVEILTPQGLAGITHGIGYASGNPTTISGTTIQSLEFSGGYANNVLIYITTIARAITSIKIKAYIEYIKTS